MSDVQTVIAPLEIKNIKEFIDGLSTFSKGDLRVILLDQQNRLIYIPLSQISSGGEGGSQTIDQVLETGNIATDKQLIFDYDSESGTVLINSTGISAKSSSPDFAQSTITTTTYQNSQEEDIIAGALVLGLGNNTSSTLVSNSDNTLSDNIFILPKGSIDNTAKTLATIDDISELGSQDLQQTLDNGAVASLSSDDPDQTNVSFIQFNKDALVLENRSDTGINTSLSIGFGDIALSASQGDFFNTIGFSSPLSFSSIKFPNPEVDGDYVIATTKDISLQSMIDNNLSTATKGASTINLLSDDLPFTSFTSIINNGLEGEDYSATTIKNVRDSVVLQAENINNFQSIRVDVDRITLNTSNAEGNIFTKISTVTPTVNSDISFPSPLVTGNYTIATTDQIDIISGIDDPTVIPYTQTTLNTIYPSSVNGTRIRCIAINLTYEKTTTSWIQYAIAVVTL